MLYQLLVFPARLALRFYCRRIVINKPSILHEKGPLLIAANHPNSFLDAIILASLFKYPVYSLARGDAFLNKFVNRLLRALHMLPVYRVSEGVENLEHNYTTFEAVQHLFEKNKVVLIFSEGLCINEWHLRPLKKGTARLAMTAWSQSIPLRVLPCGINYSNFRHFGKMVIINFGDLITADDIPEDITGGKRLLKFNELLEKELTPLVYEIEKEDKKLRDKLFFTGNSTIKQILIALPAAIGYLLHKPFYFIAQMILHHRTDNHYDSIMVGILFLFYPWYLLLLTLILFFITSSPLSFLLLILMPLTALCLLHFRKVMW